MKSLTLGALALGLLIDVQGVAASSFDDIVAECKARERIEEVQAPPRHIMVSCEDNETKWVAAEPGEIPLPGLRSMTLSVTSHMLNSCTEKTSVPVTPKSGACTRFQEVTETLLLQRHMTCDEVLKLKMPLAQFCAQSVDEAKIFQPKLIIRQPTGRVIDTCPTLPGAYQ